MGGESEDSIGLLYAQGLSLQLLLHGYSTLTRTKSKNEVVYPSVQHPLTANQYMGE